MLQPSQMTYYVQMFVTHTQEQRLQIVKGEHDEPQFMMEKCQKVMTPIQDTESWYW